MSAFAHDDHGPTTPPGPSRTRRLNGAMRTLDTHPPGQETFFDDATPADSARDSRAESESDQLRDSHDLSFAEGATARHSVVDNMLLSLDQFAPGNMFGGAASSRHEDNAFFLRDNSYRPPGNRHRGHTYTSSRSSDYDLHPEDATPRYPSHSRARRSNSSNNIALSMHKSGSARDPYGARQANAAYAHYQQTAHMRGAGKKGSKSSGSSSMDFGQAGVLGTHRLGFGKRSASFDHSNVSGMHSVKNESVLDRGRTAYQNYDQDYDAAPEPTIPAGPRRMPLPPQTPVAQPPQQSVYAPSLVPGPRRRGSVRSNASYRTLKKGKSQLEPSMRAQAQEFVNAITLHDMPSIPVYQEATAPAPTVGTRKSLFGSQDPASAPKERPGFFRRVFGGSSSKVQTQSATSSHTVNTAPTAPSASIQQARSAEVDSVYANHRPRTTPSNNVHIANQIKSLPKVPQTAGARSNEMQPSHPPVLAKKPSSFFRRRKKSVSETTRPPIMSLDFAPPAKPFILEQPSPSVSSLRQVMNPYLEESPAAHEKLHTDQYGEHPQGFSPGYKPHKDATMRPVKSSPRDDASPAPSSRNEQANSWQRHGTDSPEPKPNIEHGKPAVTPQEDTFLADSSSCNEDRSGRATPVHEPSGAVGTRRPSLGPTSSSFNQTLTEGMSEPEARGDMQPGLLFPNARVTSSSGPAWQLASTIEDESWVVSAPTQEEKIARGRSPTARRVWLDTTVSDESPVDGDDSLQLPLEGARSSSQPLDKSVPTTPDVTSSPSPNDVFYSATSLPIVHIETRDSDTATMPSIVEDRSTHPEPTDADRERALKIFSGNESALLKSQAAATLGDVTLSSARTRRAFMDLFDWTGITILAAMRDMCGKLVLKAETQQVDRILMSLAERWCECNPNHGFKEVDVVHTICYSILLLNTDLHVADIETRMTRNQFVKNTLPTVTRVCQDAIKADETLRPKSTHFRRGSLPWNDKSEPTTPIGEQTVFPADVTEETGEGKRVRSRLSVRPPIRSGSEGLLSFDSVASDSTTLVNTPYNGPIKGWEHQVETVLKEYYESIRKQRLPLHGASDLTVHRQSSSNNLSVGGMLRRSPSVLSKAPSDTTSYRGRSQSDFRSVGARWASKNRSKQRLYPASTVTSSRTSLDDTSVWSPAGSSTWSRYSYGKTGTSMSVDSLGSHFAAGDYQQAIGFANALSQAIIREEGMTIASDEDFARAAPLLEDESLELVGAPWAKEGILKHKHHLETVDRKAKDRAWSENFAVIEKGYMRLFSFSMNSKSARMKSKAKPAAGGIVGGGNWMDNAEVLEAFPLRQTIASALPPPGYSKTRPHVWALSLPTGAVHLFQVGTPDIVREFVSTANYWSARLSKEPLTGGVSSMEYGWGENVINPALIRQDSMPSVQGHMPRPSVASSLRSSMDHATGAPRPRLPGDKVTLSDWSPPTASMMASNLMEVDQLRALTDYVKTIEDDLAHHNELRAPLLITFSPRHPNAAKALANWERKSQYLLKEIVKFRTYIDTLALAQSQKDKIYAEREARGELDPDTNGDEAVADEVDGASEAPKASGPSNA